MFNRKRHKKRGIHHIQTNRFIQNVNTKMHLNVFHHEQQYSRLLKRNVTFCYICLHQLLKVLYHKVLYFSNGWNECMIWSEKEMKFSYFLILFFHLSFLCLLPLQICSSFLMRRLLLWFYFGFTILAII